MLPGHTVLCKDITDPIMHCEHTDRNIQRKIGLIYALKF